MGRISDDEEVLEEVVQLHEANKRCAVVVEWGKMSYFLAEAV